VEVTVITPTLPERAELLRECIASVEAQTCPAKAHLIWTDTERRGCAAALNMLWPRVQTEWVAVLADDDVMYPNHLETLLAQAQVSEYEGEVGVVYSYCHVLGRPDGWNPNRPFNARRVLSGDQGIPATALIRRTLVEKLGGWRNWPNMWEDQDFWIRAVRGGARFVCVQRITWAYRFHDTNSSLAASTHPGCNEHR